MGRPYRACHSLPALPGRCPGLACLRTVGAPSRQSRKLNNRFDEKSAQPGKDGTPRCPPGERQQGGRLRGAHASRVLVAASRRDELSAACGVMARASGIRRVRKFAKSGRLRQHARTRALPGTHRLALHPRDQAPAWSRTCPRSSSFVRRRVSEKRDSS